MKSSDYMTSLSFSGSFSNSPESIASSPARKRSEEPSRKKSTVDEEIVVFPQDKIHSSFFIVDDYGQDEGADAAKIILYFHPDSVPLPQRLALQAGCSAVIAFSANFGPPVTVLSLESRAKMAFLQEGKYTFVLTGSEKDGDLTLSRHLAHLYRAFRFLNNSMDSIAQASEGDRDNFLARMAHVGSELLPTLRAYHHVTSRAFQPLATVELPRGGTRLLLFARQLLNSVLVPQPPSPPPPTTSTSNITTSSSSSSSSTSTTLSSSESSSGRSVTDSSGSVSMERISAPSPSPSPNHLRTTTYGAAVFYDQSVLCLQMNKSIARFVSCILQPKPASDELRMQSNLSGSSSSAPLFLSDSDSTALSSEVELRHVWAPRDIYTNPKPNWDGELCEMALLVFSCGRVALALLLDTATAASPDAIQQLRAAVDSRLSQLDSQLAKMLRELPNPTHSVQGIACIHHHFLPGENTNSVHNSLVFSELTQTCKGTEATIDFGEENPFLSTASLVHDTFEEMPDTTQIILKDHQGIYHCKKNLTRETYLHFPPMNPIYADRSLEKLEREVRRVLESEVQAPPPL